MIYLISFIVVWIVLGAVAWRIFVGETADMYFPLSNDRDYTLNGIDILMLFFCMMSGGIVFIVAILIYLVGKIKTIKMPVLKLRRDPKTGKTKFVID